MGNLIINHLTFTFGDEEYDRYDSLQNFIFAVNHARENGDVIYGTEGLYNFAFIWGNFFSDLIYKNYSELKKLEHWSWLPQTLHQTLMVLFFQNPSGKTNFSDIATFKKTFENANSNCGTIGCECVAIKNTDVYNLLSWNLWNINFYKANPKLYGWKELEDNFLPNKLYSNKILEEELKKHRKFDKIVEGNVGLAFHDEVMRLKGSSLRAYAVEIGSIIAESNYYSWEEELSKNEQRISKSPRKIFSFLDKNQKNIYISIDHAHGMFEFHNHSGEHKGEYKFDGSLNSGPDITHNLKTIKI